MAEVSCLHLIMPSLEALLALAGISGSAEQEEQNEQNCSTATWLPSRGPTELTDLSAECVQTQRTKLTFNSELNSSCGNWIKIINK